MPQGYYDDNQNLIELDGKFPDIDRVIPSDMHLSKKTILNVDDLTVRGEGKIQGYDLKISAKRKEDGVIQHFGVQVSYLKQAIAMGDDIHMIGEGYDTRLIVKNEERLAVVMPMRL